MPTYDYLCRKCGHRFEQFQKVSDGPLQNCPQCHGKVERLISGGMGLIFKGSGFYITDYKNTSKKEKKTADKKAPEKKKSTDKKSTGKKDAA